MKLVLLCGVFILCLTICHGARAATSLKEVQNQIHTVSDVISWLEHHLAYRNISEWDPAPPLDSVIRDGFGDCKMLAGVTSELLSDIGVTNWIVTIRPTKYYHMFVVFRDETNDLRVINNARLVPQSFSNWDSILKHFNATHIVEQHTTYRAFQKWFNRIYEDVLRQNMNRPLFPQSKSI